MSEEQNLAKALHECCGKVLCQMERIAELLALVKTIDDRLSQVQVPSDGDMTVAERACCDIAGMILPFRSEHHYAACKEAEAR